MSVVHAIISIHDVSPVTIQQVQGLIALVPENCQKNLLLLIIPGGEWSQTDLQQLKNWQEQGFTLAGHGWHHQVAGIKGWYHRLHSWLISRDAAEHLALEEGEIAVLLKKNYRWFIEHNLKPPQLYVPPAWAMGSIAKSELTKLPFQYYEFTDGIYDAKNHIYKKLPLAGFEADTILRKQLLKLWNKINCYLSSSERPLRLSLHPNDNSLLLKESFKSYLSQVRKSYSCQSIFL